MNPIDLMDKASKAAGIRLVADCSGEEVTAEKAQWLIEHAAVFIETVRQKLGP